MIKFLDLQSQYQSIQNQINQGILEVLQSGEFVGGKYLQAFEANFAKEVGCSQALGVGNGTDAIEIALRAFDFEPQSEVILPANTFFGTLEAVCNAGLKPVLIDCGEDYCINPSLIPQAITPKTRAIIPVHLYGRMCDMSKIIEIAREHKLKVIEDCAQSFGAQIQINQQIKKAGNIGDCGCFSFYPGKNLGAYGDGGAITSSDSDFIQKCRSIANHGRAEDKYNHLCIGRNSRLDAIQAQVLNIKLNYIYHWNEKRKDIAELYQQTLSNISSIILPPLDIRDRSVWHLYVIRLTHHKAKTLLEYLANLQIQCGIHYPINLANLKATQKLNLTHCPNASSYQDHILSLPMGEHLTHQEIFQISQAITEFFG